MLSFSLGSISISVTIRDISKAELKPKSERMIKAGIKKAVLPSHDFFSLKGILCFPYFFPIIVDSESEKVSTRIEAIVIILGKMTTDMKIPKMIVIGPQSGYSPGLSLFSAILSIIFSNVFKDIKSNFLPFNLWTDHRTIKIDIKPRTVTDVNLLVKKTSKENKEQSAWNVCLFISVFKLSLSSKRPGYHFYY